MTAKKEEGKLVIILVLIFFNYKRLHFQLEHDKPSFLQNMFYVVTTNLDWVKLNLFIFIGKKIKKHFTNFHSLKPAFSLFSV